MMDETALMDPMAEYCKRLCGVLEGQIKKAVDTFYEFYLKRGMCKADAIWKAIEDTQEMFNGVDLTVNFDGPMQ